MFQRESRETRTEACDLCEPDTDRTRCRGAYVPVLRNVCVTKRLERRLELLMGMLALALVLSLVFLRALFVVCVAAGEHPLIEEEHPHTLDEGRSACVLFEKNRCSAVLPHEPCVRHHPSTHTRSVHALVYVMLASVMPFTGLALK